MCLQKSTFLVLRGSFLQELRPNPHQLICAKPPLDRDRAARRNGVSEVWETRDQYKVFVTSCHQGTTLVR